MRANCCLSDSGTAKREGVTHEELIVVEDVVERDGEQGDRGDERSLAWLRLRAGVRDFDEAENNITVISKISFSNLEFIRRRQQYCDELLKRKELKHVYI